MAHPEDSTRTRPATKRRQAIPLRAAGVLAAIIFVLTAGYGSRRPAPVALADSGPSVAADAALVAGLAPIGNAIAPPTLQAAATEPVTSSVALTTTTVSLYRGNLCAVWGRTSGAFATVTVPAGPVLLSFTTYSRYTDKPHHEYKYTFVKRVGDSTAGFSLDGQAVPVLYRGELRIEYLPVPVSKRYSYTTYALVTLQPGTYQVGGTWIFASGEKDVARHCQLAVTP